jgi:tRNA(fMet)-specific endonuclease VapC
VAFLLDTNIVSDLVRHPHTGQIARHIEQVGEERICTSIIVAAELHYGAAKSGSRRLSRLVEGALARIKVLPFEEPAETTYAKLRVALERRGRLLGSNDLWIAAHALTLGHTLVTANTREFARVPGLECENWLSP